MIVYDRGTFSVIPAVYPDDSVKANLMSILPPVDSSNASAPRPSSPPPPSSGRKHVLSTTDIVAIICFIALAAFLAATTVYFRWRRAKKRKVAESRSVGQKHEVGELEGLANERRVHEMYEPPAIGIVNRLEMGGGIERSEMPGAAGDDGAIEVESREWSGMARTGAGWAGFLASNKGLEQELRHNWQFFSHALA